MGYGQGVTLVTTTGLRPEAFGLCCHYVLRQTYTGPIQWVIVDDGHPPMEFYPEAFTARGIEVTRLFPKPSWMPGQNTLARNILVSLPAIKNTYTFFIEDDDWYAPDYLQAQLAEIGEAGQLVGERPAVYYNIQRQLYMQLWNNVHASFCSTGVHCSVLPMLQRICLDSNSAIDIRLWGLPKLYKRLYVGQRTLGIKAMPGRPGLGSGHQSQGSGLPWNYDADWQYLRTRVGADYLHYQALSTKDTDGEFEIFWWKGQKRYKCNQSWPNGGACAFDTFNYQELLSHVAGHVQTRPKKYPPARASLSSLPSPILGPNGQPISESELREQQLEEPSKKED